MLARFPSRAVRALLSVLALSALTSVAIIGPAPSASAHTPVAATQMRINQDGSGNEQNETVVVVNPSNPNNVVGAANDYRPSGGVGYYVTTNGGTSWSDGILPMPTGVNSFSDPVLRFNRDGSSLYAAQLGQESTGAVGPCDPVTGIYVNTSSNGGTAWANGVQAAANSSTVFNDKPWLTDDRSTGNAGKSGNLYLSYTKFRFADLPNCQASTATDSPIKLKRSTDGGATWGSEVDVSGSFTDAQGSADVVTPDGTVYVAFLATCGTSDCIFSSRSTDAGQTFTQTQVAHVTASNDISAGVSDTFRADSFPSIASDASGRLYTVWGERRTGTTSNDIYMSSSSNGTTWSSPSRVNTVATGDQFFPAVTVDSSGVVWVSYSDRRDDPQNILYRQYVSHSHDNGITWDDLQVASAPSDPRAVRFSDNSLFIGDYNSIDAIPGAAGVWMSWCDTRNSTTSAGEEDIFAGRVDSTGSTPSLTASVSPSTPSVWGTTFQIAGALSDSTGLLAGKAVQIQQRMPGAAVWSNLGAAGTTNANGAYSIPLDGQNGRSKPSRNTEIRAIFLGGGGLLGAQTGPRLIQVRVGIPFSVSNAALVHGQTATFTGSVLPAHPGKKVNLQMLTNSGWGTVQTVTLNSQSRYQATARLSSAGFRLFRAVFATQGTDHIWNISRNIGVRWS